MHLTELNLANSFGFSLAKLNTKKQKSKNIEKCLKIDEILNTILDCIASIKDELILNKLKKKFGIILKKFC